MPGQLSYQYYLEEYCWHMVQGATDAVYPAPTVHFYSTSILCYFHNLALEFLFFSRTWKKLWATIRFLLISLKLSEIAGKLTPANPNFWSRVPSPYKSIALVHLLLSFCGHNLETSLTCPEKDFCQQPLFFWNVLLGSGDKDFAYFPSGLSNTPVAFLSSASLHIQTGTLVVYPSHASPQCLSTDARKGDLRLLDTWDWNLHPNLKTQHEKLITLITKKII